MKTEKKLIAYSAIALLIGVASIAPLLFLMSGTAKAETTLNKPWFNLNVPYAYLEAGNGSLEMSPGPTNFTIQNVDRPNFEYERSMVVVNFTLNVDLKNEPDDRSEYFQIQIDSDKGPIENITYSFGSYGASIASAEFLKPENFHFDRSNWFDSNVTAGALYMLHNFSYTSQLWPIGQSGSGTIGHSSSSKIASAIKEANTIFITVHRLGWVTFSGNSTVVTLSDNGVVAQIQLNKFGNGFLYNTLIPEDTLSQIDPNYPLTIDPSTGLDIPNLNP